MKEFNKSETITYNLMSFTAFKSLFIFSLLLKAPQSYVSLKEAFREHKYLREDVSTDTLRVYLTSLKRSGCVIEKMKKPDNGKYKLVSHPFELKISEDQIKGLIKIYKIILKSADFSDIYEYEKFINNLAVFTKNDTLREAMEKVSVFKNIDKNVLDELVKYSKQKLKITVLYNSPRTNQKEIDIITDSLNLTDGKVYLSGIGLEYNKEANYLAERIIKIVDVDLENKPKIKLQPITVRYELSSVAANTKLADYEKIVEIKDDYVIIEAQTTNKFDIKRKIMEYGPCCTVLSPKDFREDIINTLKEMRAAYKND